MPKKCKSNEVAIPSGERSRNTWATCPRAGDNNPKGLLIPHVKVDGIINFSKPCALWDGPAAYQLVGGVTAYQGFDG